MELTREQIEQIHPGRALDILIATRVLGWTMHRNGRTTGEAWAKLEWEHDFVPAEFNADLGHAKPVPHYSTDIAAAKQVQAKLLEAGWDITIYYVRTVGGHHVTVHVERHDRELSKHCRHLESAATEALATARVALLAAQSEAEAANQSTSGAHQQKGEAEQ